MAVPKRKTSKARRDKRRSSTWKLNVPGFTVCPNCKELILPHRVCKNCNFYKGKEVGNAPATTVNKAEETEAKA